MVSLYLILQVSLLCILLSVKMVKSLQLMPTKIPGLLTIPHEYPFGGTETKTRAFFIPGPDPTENVWMYSSSRTTDYLKQIEQLGGVRQQLLTHRDEAGPFCNALKNAPILCHELEVEAITAKIKSDLAQPFSGKEHIVFEGDDGSSLVAFHLPGHTPGASLYVWTFGSDEKTTVFFSGDTLYINSEGKWEHGPLTFHAYPGHIQDMIATFEWVLELRPTYVVPSLVQGGSDDFVNLFDEEQLRGLIAKLKEQG